MRTRGSVIRSQVLSVLKEHRKPMSGYELLDHLRAFNPKIAPPTVYRALAVLTKDGDVHRLESLNAFVACRCGDHDDPSIMAICEDCGAVEENIAPAVIRDVSDTTAKTGFAPTRHVIEVHGRCAACDPSV
ncbi:MAG: transcriptional repressor [Pseudomonadota bacterium]